MNGADWFLFFLGIVAIAYALDGIRGVLMDIRELYRESLGKGKWD